MSLISCPECDKQVSEKANSCPGCGCPIAGMTSNANLSPSQPDNYIEIKLGLLDSMAGYTLSKEVVCPHCQKRGCVITKPSKIKKGISGGKATGAILTLGFSMLATGLSRKEKVTEAQCKNCNSVWHY